MSVKKLLVLSAASLAMVGATAAMAGGPDHMAMPSAAAFENSVYVDGHGGFALSNWRNFNANNVMGPVATSSFSPLAPNSTSHGRGYWTGGVDLGYNLVQHIAVEAGWFHLPTVTGGSTRNNIGATGAQTGTAAIKSWFAYAAARLNVPFVWDDLELFGKVGVAYRSLSYALSSPTVAMTSITGNGHYWAPVFGVGTQYTWGDWLFGGQYMFLPSNSSVNLSGTVTANTFGAPNAAPSVNLFTLFVGYKFAV